MVDHSSEIQQLQIRAQQIEYRLQALNGKSTDRHLDAVAKAFPLGMVGGSGRNTHKLNQRRERSLDKTISNAVESNKLHQELKEIEAKIIDLQAGGPEKRKQIRDAVRKAEKQRDKEKTAAMTPADRLFIGDYPGGIVYADRAVMRNGDYKRLAFLSRSSKKLQFDAKRIQPELLQLIESHAASDPFKI